jgi:hypothetical protein
MDIIYKFIFHIFLIYWKVPPEHVGAKYFWAARALKMIVFRPLQSISEVILSSNNGLV